MFNFYPRKLNTNDFMISSSCLNETQELINKLNLKIYEGFRFEEIFEYLFLLRVYKQWVLSFDNNCHQLKKDIDFEIKKLFDELNVKYSDLSKFTSYFFSPHRYSLRSINLSIFSQPDLKNYYKWFLSCNDSPIHIIKSSNEFIVKSSHLEVNSLFSYSFLIYKIMPVIKNNKRKILITDGTLPTIEILYDYSFCIVINGLHLAEIKDPNIKFYLKNTIKSLDSNEIDFCIGFKDWLRINCNVNSANYFSLEKLVQISSDFKKELDFEQSKNINFLHFKSFDQIISNNHYDIWGYKIDNYLINGTKEFFDSSIETFCKLHSHNFEHKLCLI